MPVSNVAAQTGTPQGAPLDLAIVILNFNTCDLLRDCLRSLQRQPAGVRVKVCVVDNASTDDSAEMVRHTFPDVELVVNRANLGYSAGNNVGLRWFGFGRQMAATHLPRYALLLNPDTLAPPGALAAMVRFMDEHPSIGGAGPRVRRPDGSLDRACRRSFPTPQISFYRMVGLSRLFPRSRRFNAYNLEYLPEDAVHPVDSVVGAYMQVRGAVIEHVGLLDESFFMYGEDLDWAKRIKDAGWEVWYNGQVEITHVKEAASRQSAKTRIDFYEAMWLFYAKHYRQETSWLLDKVIRLGIAAKGGVDVSRHLWRYCRPGRAASSARPGAVQEGAGEGRFGLDAAEPL
jgi:N-acetylglucosaminyl-diphospho-decaprenol L-rhamnosyltransferase